MSTQILADQDAHEPQASVRAALDALFVCWSPILGREQRPLGVRVQVNPQSAPSMGPWAPVLDALIHGFAQDGGVGFPHGLVSLAVNTQTSMSLDASLLTWHAPRNVVLELPATALADEASLRFLYEVHRSGVRFALRLRAQDALPEASRLAMFEHILIDAEHLASIKAVGLASEASFWLVQERDAAMARQALQQGVSAVVGCALAHETAAGVHTLAPTQKAVLELIRLVQSDAEVEDIERAFKHEPVLAYMLLTLANSPAFVRTTPIGSIRHAVTLLGYRRLLKWLVLLMVVSAKQVKALAQIHSAVVRGFYMENLAAARGTKPTVQDEAFIVGVFSLLGAITGQSLPALLQDLLLPAAITEALLEQSGALSPYLNLAVASEGAAHTLAHQWQVLTKELDLTPEAVNRALLQALSAADALLSVV